MSYFNRTRLYMLHAKVLRHKAQAQVEEDLELLTMLSLAHLILIFIIERYNAEMSLDRNDVIFLESLETLLS